MDKWKKYWLFYSLVVIIFTVLSCIFWNKEWASLLIQLGGVIITIIAMLVIMIQNGEQISESTEKQIISIIKTTHEQISELQNATSQQIESNRSENEKLIKTIHSSTKDQIIELQNSTQKQIDNYRIESDKIKENFNEIINKQIESFASKSNDTIKRLEDVTEILIKMSEQNSELLKKEEEKIKKSEEQWLIKVDNYREIQFEKLEEQERVRPLIYFRTEVQPYLIFWKRLYFYIYNDGGDAHKLRFQLRFYNNTSYREESFIFDSINRLNTAKVRLQDYKNYIPYDNMMLTLHVHDKSDRHYYSENYYLRRDIQWEFINIENVQQRLN